MHILTSESYYTKNAGDVTVLYNTVTSPVINHIIAFVKKKTFIFILQTL